MEGRRGLQAVRARRAFADGYAGGSHGRQQRLAARFARSAGQAYAASNARTTDAANARQPARSIGPKSDARIVSVDAEIKRAAFEMERGSFH